MSLDRRAFALAGTALALGLGGCAAGDVPVAPRPATNGSGLLTQWSSINGGWLLKPATFLQPAVSAGQRLNFVQPVGVAVQGEVLLVADAGARSLWRLDRGRDEMATFAPFSGSANGSGTSLHLGNDLSTWVALPAEHMVVQYDVLGRELRRWRDDANAPRPVAVAVPENRSELLVGDAATARVVVFDPLGRIRRIVGSGRSGALQSITAMALGPGGLYVLDRAAQQVIVLGAQGEVLEVIGENELVQPRALAVDRSGRVFVSDDVDQRIKVFRGAQLLGTAGGDGNGPGRFGRIEAMAIDGNLLYVADSVNARVQVMLIAPPSMEGPGATP
jgi:DNA-binding beta-propeller fold protein YncE